MSEPIEQLVIVKRQTRECRWCDSEGMEWVDCGDSTCDCGGREIRCTHCRGTRIQTVSETDVSDAEGHAVIDGQVMRVEGDTSACSFPDAEHIGAEATADYCYAHQQFCGDARPVRLVPADPQGGESSG